MATINPHRAVTTGGTFALLLAAVAMAGACNRSPKTQPESIQATEQTPPAASARVEAKQPPPVSEATKVGALTDPAFQKPAVATDPSFPEARGSLLSDVPDFPTYPNATLVGSAQQNRIDQPIQGYRIKWTTKDSVPAVMAWYQKALVAAGWTYKPPDDGALAVEQLARISKGGLSGYVAAEASGEATEIVVSLKKQ
jgi:hypothetical protein